MVKSIFRHRNLILDICSTEVKRKYAGTVLGPVWAIAPQILTVAAFWFVFEIGLKIGDEPGEMPFFYYFSLGILPWFLFFDAFSNSVNSIRENAHLITKMVFPSEIFPIVKFLVASIPHLVLLFLMSVMLWINGLLSPENLPWLLYFYGCTAFLAVGLGWLISSISVFAQDAAHAAQLAVSLLFWVTPIMWQMNAIPESWQWLFDLNPLSHIICGYRFAMTGSFPFDINSFLSFWGVTLIICFAGLSVFFRLKHHFADVL